jgi:hypothetical protein
MPVNAVVSPARTGIVFVFTDANNLPANLTALTTSPQLTTQSLNGGVSFTLTNPIWGPAGASGLPWLYYPILTGAIGSDDTPTLTASSGWATTTAGVVGALSAQPVNNTDKVTLLPGFVEGPKTMQVGFNLGSAPNYYMSVPVYANLARNIVGWSSVIYGATYTIDQFGYPASISSGGILETIVSICPTDGTGSTKGIYNLPSSGTWTLLWDGAGTGSGGQPLLFLNSGGLQGESLTETSRNLTGTTDNKIQYQITQDQTYHYSPVIYLRVTGAPFSNLRVYPPDIATDGSQKFHPEYLKKIAGVKCLRFMSTIDSNMGYIVDYEDFTPIQKLGYSMVTRQPGGSVVQVDPYPDTENYFGNVPSALLTFSAAHNYKDGDIVSPNIPGPNTDGGFPLANGQNGYLKPPPGGGGYTVMGRLQANSNQLAVPFSYGISQKTTLTTTYYAPIPQPTNGTWAAKNQCVAGLPLSEVTDLCNMVGTDLWFCVDYNITDDCATSLFTFLAQQLKPGLKLYVEYSNECWNYGYPFFGQVYCNANGRVSGLGQFGFYAHRANQIHNLAESALAAYGRGRDLVRVFGAQGAWAGNSTQSIVNYSVSHNIPIDAIAVAPYLENGPSPFVSGTNVTSGSTYDLLNSDQLMDLGDLYVQYARYGRYVSDHYAVLASHYPNAKVLCYEGGPELGLPGSALGWGSTSWVVRQHIWGRHPRMRWIMLHFLQMLQDQGCTLYNDFVLSSGYEFSQGWNWLCYYAWDMKPGMGDGSDGLSDNRVNFEDYPNLVSVIGGAINYWNSLIATYGVDTGKGSGLVWNDGCFNQLFSFSDTLNSRMSNAN